MEHLNENLIPIIGLLKEKLIKVANLKKANNSPLKEFYTSIAHRTLFALDAGAILLAQMGRLPYMRYPYIQIMRTVLMDLIIAERMTIKEEQGEVEVNKFLHKINTEHRNTIYRSKELLQNAFADDPDFQSFLKSQIQSVIDEYGDNLEKIKINTISLLTSFDELHLSRDRHGMKNVIELYDQYFWISKLVHFGELSMEYLLKLESKTGYDLLLRNLKLIIISSAGLLIHLGIKIEDDDEIFRLMDKLK